MEVLVWIEKLKDVDTRQSDVKFFLLSLISNFNSASV